MQIGNNKTIDVGRHKRFIHSDMFRLPSATIFIEILVTTDFNKTGRNNKMLRLNIIKS